MLARAERVFLWLALAACWVAMLLAISGCGLRPFGAEASFAVMADDASIVQRERAALGGGPLLAAPLEDARFALVRQRALALCPLLPAAVQVRCLLSQL